MLWKKCSLWLFFWRIICLQQTRSRAEGSWVYLHCFHHYSQEESCLSNGVLFPPTPQGHTLLTRCVSFLRRWGLFLRDGAFSGCTREGKDTDSFPACVSVNLFTCHAIHAVWEQRPKMTHMAEAAAGASTASFKPPWSDTTTVQLAGSPGGLQRHRWLAVNPLELTASRNVAWVGRWQTLTPPSTRRQSVSPETGPWIATHLYNTYCWCSTVSSTCLKTVTKQKTVFQNFSNGKKKHKQSMPRHCEEVTAVISSLLLQEES